MPRAIVACRDPFIQEWLAVQLCRASLVVQTVSDAPSLRKLCDAELPALVVGEPELLPVQMPPPTHWVVLGVPSGLEFPPSANDLRAELTKLGHATPALRMNAFALAPPPAEIASNRRQPPPPLPDVLPLSASLKQVTWPRLLVELHLGGFSGQLRVTGSAGERKILWQRGQIAAVHEAQGDTAMQRAAEHGHWSAEVLAQVTAYLLAHPGQTASALYDAKLMSLAELAATLSAHYKTLLLDAFAWSDAQYKIEAEPLVGTLGLEGAINVWPLLTASVERSFKTGDIVEALAPVAAQFILPTPRYARVSANVLPYLPCWQAARLLNGETTFQVALMSDTARAAQLAQEIFTLWSCQLIRANKEPQKIVASPVANAPPPAAAPLTAVDYRALSLVISTITEAHTQVGKVDHFALLGVPRDANATAIETAFTARMRDMHLTQLPPGLSDDVVKRASQLLLALKQARFTLVDPLARQRYVAGLKP